MNKKKKKNPLIFVGIVAVVLVAAIIICSILGVDLFATLSGEASNKPIRFCDVNELESGKAYVWHHENGDLKKDLLAVTESPVYFTCMKGDYNFKNKEKEEALEYPRSIWIPTSMDDTIPTVTKDDRLIYVSSTEVPDGILFERFADYGYSIGVSNMMADSGGHYFIEYASVDEDDYKYYVDLKSDAAQISTLEPITKLYLDKVGDIKVDEKNVSEGGSVLGLTKDKNYICEFYTGTFYQDFKIKADVHSFSSLERFTSYEYEFMHSNFIVISIPEYFKSGYYFVNGVGLFRYVAESDEGTYNGKTYDEKIDWNDPIIVYNENGEVIENPSDPDFVAPADEFEHSDPGVEIESEQKETETNEHKEAEITEGQVNGT